MDEADRNALKVMLGVRKFDPSITHIRFPHYKNLAGDPPRVQQGEAFAKRLTGCAE